MPMLLHAPNQELIDVGVGAPNRGKLALHLSMAPQYNQIHSVSLEPMGPRDSVSGVGEDAIIAPLALRGSTRDSRYCWALAHACSRGAQCMGGIQVVGMALEATAGFYEVAAAGPEPLLLEAGSR